MRDTQQMSRKTEEIQYFVNVPNNRGNSILCGGPTMYWISFGFRDICCVSPIVGARNCIGFPVFFGTFVVYPSLWDLHRKYGISCVFENICCVSPIVGPSHIIEFPLFLETFVVCFPIVGRSKSIEHCLTCGWRVG